MKTFHYIIFLITLIATACSNSNSPAVPAIIDSDARHDDVITDTKSPANVAHMDTTELIVDSAINMTINGTPLPKNRIVVYRTLYDNWLHAYILTAHLPAVLHISYKGTVMMGARGDIMDQVVKAQDNMKEYITRDKYKTSYTSLSPGQQAEMQQQHSILFQKEFR